MSSFLGIGVLLIFILGVPIFGIQLAGNSLPTSLTLFPITTEPGEASLSWIVCGFLVILIATTLAPFLWRFFRFSAIIKPKREYQAFPWWGWLALLWITSSWSLAWTRFPWFHNFQTHTFPLLWFGYIAVLNALTLQRSGQCLLTSHPRTLGKLFLLSAGFWWLFEYLNQYVRNWHYVNLPDTSYGEFIFYTSLSFSTVLPAVLSTYEWLWTFPRLTKPFEMWQPLNCSMAPQIGWISLSLGCLGLGLMGLWPTILFPLLWLCPLCLLLGIQIIQRGPTSLLGVHQGDWRPDLLSGLAALMCGFWWELWNVYSLAHWEYTLPFVHTFKIFEMPILGYSGYLPFGLTCLAISELVLGYLPSQQWQNFLGSNQHPE